METRIVINEIDTATQVSLSSFDVGDQINIVQYTGGDITSPVISVNGKIGIVVLNKNDIGLGNVDNTSDLNKPISLATLSALNLLQTQINNLGSNNLTILQASSANWNSVYNNVNSLSSNWNSVYNNVRSLSSNWSSASAAAINYTHTNFLPLTGGTVSGETRFNNKVTIFGDLSCTGIQSFANTIFSTTTSLSVVHVGSGPALWVGNNGDGDIASFYDIDQGVEILHVGGNSGSFPNVGIKTSTPNKALTVNGEISSNNAIYDATGNSTQWNTAYNVATIVQSTSSSWEESADIDLYKTSVALLSGNWNSVYSSVSSTSASWITLPTVTNYLSTNNILISSIEVNNRVVLDDQLYYVADEDGQWLGRTKIKENNVRLNDISSNWNLILAATNVKNIAMTSDGRSQVYVNSGGFPTFSDNYGRNFNSNLGLFVSANWTGCAMSSDGKHRTLVSTSAIVPTPSNRKIYVTNNYGINWSFVESSFILNDVAMSSDGRYQTIATSNNGILISDNYGVTWRTILINGVIFSAIAMSSSGKIQTIVTNGSLIWRSNDYGNSWIVVRNVSANYSDVAMSSDGRYQFVTLNGGVIIVSKDYGVSWSNTTSINGTWVSIAVSSDGKFITALTSSVIWYSRDHGITWNNTVPTVISPWSCVGMSSDGKYQLIAESFSVYRSVASEEIEGNLNIIGSLNYPQPYARYTINGNFNIGNLSNSTEHIIPWNTEEEPFLDIIETNLANDNFTIKRNGIYHVKARFSCFDMFDASDYLRIRLRQSATPITNAAAGSLVTTLAWRFAGGGLGSAGEMYAEGETILRLTPESTGIVYLAATVLGSGGSGSGGTTFYPFFDNSQGTQPFMEVRKIA